MQVRPLSGTEWYVYLLIRIDRIDTENGGQGDRSTYVGITNDLDKRLAEHNAGRCRSTRGIQWRYQAILIAKDRQQAAIVERWLKCGDSGRKRQLMNDLVGDQSELFELHCLKLINRALMWSESRKVRQRYGGEWNKRESRS